MNKGKIVLLTMLCVVLIYCGAVVFISKPDSFAYSPKGIKSASGVLTLIDSNAIADDVLTTVDESLSGRISSEVEQQVQAVMAGLSEELLAKANADASQMVQDAKAEAVDAFNAVTASTDEKISSAKAEAIDAINAVTTSTDEKISSAKAEAQSYIDGQIASSEAEILKTVEARIIESLPILSDAISQELGLEERFAQCLTEEDVNACIAQALPEIETDVETFLYNNLDSYMPIVIASLEPQLQKNLSIYAPYIVEAVLPGLVEHEQQFAEQAYAQYKDALVEEITALVMADVTAQVQQQVSESVAEPQTIQSAQPVQEATAPAAQPAQESPVAPAQPTQPAQPEQPKAETKAVPPAPAPAAGASVKVK